MNPNHHATDPCSYLRARRVPPSVRSTASGQNGDRRASANRRGYGDSTRGSRHRVFSYLPIEEWLADSASSRKKDDGCRLNRRLNWCLPLAPSRGMARYWKEEKKKKKRWQTKPNIQYSVVHGTRTGVLREGRALMRMEINSRERRAVCRRRNRRGLRANNDFAMPFSISADVLRGTYVRRRYYRAVWNAADDAAATWAKNQISCTLFDGDSSSRKY